ELRADTAARQRAAAFTVDGGGDRVAWHVDGARSRADDYEVPGTAVREADTDPEVPAGIVPNSDFDTESAAVGAAWLGDRSTLGFAVRRFATDYGVPHAHAAHDGELDDDGHDEDEHAEHAHGERVRIDLEATRIDVRGEWLGLPRFPGIEL